MPRGGVVVGIWQPADFAGRGRPRCHRRLVHRAPTSHHSADRGPSPRSRGSRARGECCAAARAGGQRRSATAHAAKAGRRGARQHGIGSCHHRSRDPIRTHHQLRMPGGSDPVHDAARTGTRHVARHNPNSPRRVSSPPGARRDHRAMDTTQLPRPDRTHHRPQQRDSGRGQRGAMAGRRPARQSGSHRRPAR
jgi:hypothetical protein